MDNGLLFFIVGIALFVAIIAIVRRDPKRGRTHSHHSVTVSRTSRPSSRARGSSSSTRRSDDGSAGIIAVAAATDSGSSSASSGGGGDGGGGAC